MDKATVTQMKESHFPASEHAVLAEKLIHLLRDDDLEERISNTHKRLLANDMTRSLSPNEQLSFAKQYWERNSEN